MKITGFAILIIGLVIGMYTVVQFFGPSAVPGSTGSPEVGSAGSPALQFLFSAIAIGLGLYLVAFGGSGVIKTKDPAVRN